MVKLASKQSPPAKAAASDYAASFRAGDSLFREGDPGGCLFVIESGQVELLAAGQRRLALLEAGDVFGEMSVLEDRPRECEARAVSDLKVLKVDRAGLDSLLRQSPEVATLLMRRLARRLDEARLGTAPPPAAKAPAEAAPVVARLVHEASGTEFVLPPETRAVVGRSATGHMPDVDLAPVDRDRSLSRRHAVVWSERGRYFVSEEKGVNNGTFLNGRRLKTGDPEPLADGDKLAFGLVKTTFHLA
jgi:hypothetical protein